jgi:Ca2+-dependent lipid-binding protein
MTLGSPMPQRHLTSLGGTLSRRCSARPGTKTHTHTHTHTHKHMHTHTSAHQHQHAQRTHTHTHTHRCMLRELLDMALEEGDILHASCPPNGKGDCFEVCVCVCVCVCVYAYTYTFTYTYIHIYIYTCTCIYHICSRSWQNNIFFKKKNTAVQTVLQSEGRVPAVRGVGKFVYHIGQ